MIRFSSSAFTSDENKVIQKMRLYCFLHDRRTIECRKRGDKFKQCLKSKPAWWKTGTPFTAEKQEWFDAKRRYK